MRAIAIRKSSLNRLSTYAGLLLTAVVTFSGSRAVQPAAPVNPNPLQHTAVQPKPVHHHWYEIGRASWYGKLFQGHQTASGEDFDMNALTCAHRSLPLGSLVRVTNLRNHKSVVVRVNDRGPVPEDRVVDLSYAAARLLGFSHRGTARVGIELVNSRTELAQLNYPLASH